MWNSSDLTNWLGGKILLIIPHSCFGAPSLAPLLLLFLVYVSLVSRRKLLTLYAMDWVSKCTCGNYSREMRLPYHHTHRVMHCYAALGWLDFFRSRFRLLVFMIWKVQVTLQWCTNTLFQKSNFWSKKFNFDKTLQFFSGNQRRQQLKCANPQHFYEFFTQIFLDNFSCEIKVVNS